MDSINSWINEDEVRKLAEDLSSAPESVKAWEESDYDGFALPEAQGQGDTQEEDISQEVKAIKSSSLAGASAMAASAGLLGAKRSGAQKSEVEKGAEVVSESVTKPALTPVELQEAGLPSLCDHSLHSVPGEVDENARVSIPTVHVAKALGTFEEIDKQLTSTVKADGICVIDRDGDVLYSSLKNHSLVSFTIDSMMGTKLMGIDEGEFGNIRVKISAKEYLEFVSVKSTRGVLVLAASMDHVLGSKNAEFVAGDMLKIANMA